MIRTILQSVVCSVLSPLLVAQQLPDVTLRATSVSGPATPVQSSVITIPEGTQVPLVLLEPISSATARKGQLIRFAVARDVIMDGIVVIRRGTGASGVVIEARRAIRGKKDGYVSFDLVSLTLPDGSIPVTRYVGGGSGAGEDGWCAGLGSCVVLAAFLYVFYLPIELVKSLFDRRHPTVSGMDETNAACMPVRAVTKATYLVDIGHSDSPQSATEVDSTCSSLQVH